MLSYLPSFSAVCVLVTVVTMEDPAHLDKSTLLSCLFEGDSGRVSPNTVVSYHIRHHGGDVFSAAVRQYGFPYKWVQTLCGISGLMTGAGEGGGEWGEVGVQLEVNVSVESMESVMGALRRRLRAQVNLARQIARLGECVTPASCPVCVCVSEEGNTEEGEVEESAAATLPQSQLVRWKTVALSEVQVCTNHCVF